MFWKACHQCGEVKKSTGRRRGPAAHRSHRRDRRHLLVTDKAR
ncbi:MAG: hypothetical protein R2755_09680 [Acidimicrobiales bacterium]